MTAGRPLISVLIACYNGGRYLAEAIESVLKQTYPRVELIVVDDGSDDDSADVARRFGSALALVSQPRAGIGAARNRAVSLATGDFLAFLDADDRFLPDKLERQMAAFDADPAIDVVFGNVTEFITPELPSDVAARFREPARDVPWRSPSLMLVKRSSFDRVGAFSTELKVGVTVDWYARAVDLGLRIAEPGVLVLERRLHGDNNGIRERDSRSHYLRVLKASIDRRRAGADATGGRSASEPPRP